MSMILKLDRTELSMVLALKVELFSFMTDGMHSAVFDSLHAQCCWSVCFFAVILLNILFVMWPIYKKIMFSEFLQIF